LKNSDAKLKGLPLLNNASQLPNTTPAIYVTKGGNFVLKSKFMKVSFYWHLFQQRHHELLLKDCISEELKTKFKIKALYHQSKVLELFYKLDCSI
jgi:hypothetical protein